MDYIRGDSREQELLLPERLEDYVGEDDPVRFVDEFAEQLDWESCGFERGRPNSRGRPSYDPRVMLKLDRSKLRERIRLLETELQTMEELDRSMEEAGARQISETDPDSRATAAFPHFYPMTPTADPYGCSIFA